MLAIRCLFHFFILSLALVLIFSHTHTHTLSLSRAFFRQLFRIPFNVILLPDGREMSVTHTHAHTHTQLLAHSLIVYKDWMES